MSPASYLHISHAESTRHRAASLPTGHDRYVSVGGLVNIEDLTKRYEEIKPKKSKQHYYGLFGSISPRSRTSRAFALTEDAESPEPDFTPVSPRRSEGWGTPKTPQTPPSEPQQTKFTHANLQIHHSTPPPISRYNRYGQYPHLSPEATIRDLACKDLLFQSVDIITPPPTRPPPSQPVELAGSLLLPSQGFPQSDPPEVPPRAYSRSQFSALQTESLEVLTKRLDDVSPITARDLRKSCYSTLSPVSALDDPEMAKQSLHHENLQSTFTHEQETKGLSPVPKPALQPKGYVTQYAATSPTPLSQMTIEELMQILPNLDAAIVAHDWVPCMQKRHQELKTLFNKMQNMPATDITLDSLDKELGKIFETSREVAETYFNLFGMAKELQRTALHEKDAAIDEANAQKSEVMISLAQCATRHDEVCQDYEREIQEFKDVTRQALEVLSVFIHEYLSNAMMHAPQQQTQQVLDILKAHSEPKDLPTRHVSSDLYHETQKALKLANEEKQSMQEICKQQMTTINNQSRDLDQYVARMTKVNTVLHDKQRDIRNLMAENEELKLTIEAHEKAVRVENQRKLDHAQFQKSAGETHLLDSDIDTEMWSKDAEIKNLRRKLDKAFVREKDLQVQIRSLLQSSHIGTTVNRSSRLKRLLTGAPRGSPGIPTLNSMQNFGHSIYMPSEKDRRGSDVHSSPGKSARTSPSLAGFCGPTVIGELELPAPSRSHSRSQSTVEFSPRLRESIHTPEDRDIDAAISGRFYHLPSNVRSVASIIRPLTSRSSSDASFDDTREYDRPRFDSAPDSSAFDTGLSHPVTLGEDQQPLINHQRVLSGITEVTEDTGSVKRKNSSLDSADKTMYLDSMHALGRLQIHY